MTDPSKIDSDTKLGFLVGLNMGLSLDRQKITPVDLAALRRHATIAALAAFHHAAENPLAVLEALRFFHDVFECAAAERGLDIAEFLERDRLLLKTQEWDSEDFIGRG